MRKRNLTKFIKQLQYPAGAMMECESGQALKQQGMADKARVIGYGYVIDLAAFVAAAAWKILVR